MTPSGRPSARAFSAPSLTWLRMTVAESRGLISSCLLYPAWFSTKYSGCSILPMSW